MSTGPVCSPVQVADAQGGVAHTQGKILPGIAKLAALGQILQGGVEICLMPGYFEHAASS